MLSDVVNIPNRTYHFIHRFKTGKRIDFSARFVPVFYGYALDVQILSEDKGFNPSERRELTKWEYKTLLPTMEQLLNGV